MTKLGTAKRDRDDAALELVPALWREVSRHLELEASLKRVAPILQRAIPIDSVLVRRIERDPLRLTTVGFGSVGDARARPTATRSNCDPESERALEAWLAARRVASCSSDPDDALGRCVLPGELRGSALVGALELNGAPVALLIAFAGRRQSFSPEHTKALERTLEPLGVAYENDQRIHELSRMREALEADRQALLTRLERQDISDTVIGAEAGLRSVMERVEQVARTDAPVLILGETGSGKEVIARAIHAGSPRKKAPIVRINCGAIPPELIDSELFGHERGSFTGAIGTRKGWFERADGGTLFLDEIGELPPAAQVRLLRVLQDGSLERVGGHQAITVDVRIVAATHRQLETMVGDGSFREDLWYRISVFPIRLPALRERAEDIPALAAYFARRAGQRLGGAALTPSAADIALLRGYAWPGNVRELSAVIERAAILGDGRRLEIAQALGTNVQPASKAPPPAKEPSPARAQAFDQIAFQTLDQAMKAHIELALVAARGRIEGPFGAAKLLQINPHTLRARMRKLKVDWMNFRKPS